MKRAARKKNPDPDDGVFKPERRPRRNIATECNQPESGLKYFVEMGRDGKWARVASFGKLADAKTYATARSHARAQDAGGYYSWRVTDNRFPAASRRKNPSYSDVRSPTSTRSEVRSPTSTSTEAQTEGNFTSTVTGGAGDGDTTVNLYPGKRQAARPRKKNPANPARETQIKQAKLLYSDFTGHEPAKPVMIDKPICPDVMSVIGEIDGIMYTTVRDGKTEKYLHKFKKSSRPLFCVSPDGLSIHVIGGSYVFGDRGIVDK